MRIEMATWNNGGARQLWIDGIATEVFWPTVSCRDDYCDTPWVWMRERLALISAPHNDAPRTERSSFSAGYGADVTDDAPEADVVRAGVVAMDAYAQRDVNALRIAIDVMVRCGALSQTANPVSESVYRWSKV